MKQLVTFSCPAPHLLLALGRAPPYVTEQTLILTGSLLGMRKWGLSPDILHQNSAF